MVFGNGGQYELAMYPRMLGHFICMGVFIVAAFIASIPEWLAHKIVPWIQWLFDSYFPVKTLHEQRESVEPILGEHEVVDEKATRGKHAFPYTPEDLIAKCKELIAWEFGSKKPELLAPDFQFVFPVVGPLDKFEFCTIFGSFKLKEAFPDSKGNYFGFTVDPTEPNRVWFFSRAKMTHSGDLTFGKLVFKPTGKEVINTPQVLSFSFNRRGECYKFTGGYSVDRTAGNCGGLGGVFGIIHSIGGSLPFPEAKPWKPSLQWEAFAKHQGEIQRKWRSMF